MKRSLVFLLLLLFSAACRMSVPTVEEQRVLIKKGSFPSGVPAWISPHAIKGTNAKTASAAGFLPEKFSAPEVVTRESELSFEERAAGTSGISVLRPRRARVLEEDLIEDKEEEEKSPLWKITELCPSIERRLNDALTTTDLSSRAQKFSELSNQCPLSADLWFWLGKDYHQIGESALAGRALERALVLDSSHEEARKLLAEVREGASESEDQDAQ